MAAAITMRPRYDGDRWPNEGHVESMKDTQALVTYAARYSGPQKYGIQYGQPVFKVPRYGGGGNGNPTVTAAYAPGSRLAGLSITRVNPGSRGTEEQDKPDATIAFSGQMTVNDNTGSKVIVDESVVLVLPIKGAGSAFRRHKLPTNYDGGITVMLETFDRESNEINFAWQALVNETLSMADAADVATVLTTVTTLGNAAYPAGLLERAVCLLLEEACPTSTGRQDYAKSLLAKVTGGTWTDVDLKRYLLRLYWEVRPSVSRFILGRAKQSAEPGRPFVVHLKVGEYCHGY
jgi:hypothetical protein